MEQTEQMAMKKCERTSWLNENGQVESLHVIIPETRSKRTMWNKRASITFSLFKQTG